MWEQMLKFMAKFYQRQPLAGSEPSVPIHYNDVTMTATASLITSLTIVCSTVYSSADQRKHQSSASLAFVRGIHRRPVNSPHKWPVTRKMSPFDDVIMFCGYKCSLDTMKLSSHISFGKQRLLVLGQWRTVYAKLLSEMLPLKINLK